MEKNGKKSRIMKGSEVIRDLGFGRTAGYRYLKFLEKNGLLQPIYLDGIKTPRWVRSEFEEFLSKREPKQCPHFVVNE